MYLILMLRCFNNSNNGFIVTQKLEGMNHFYYYLYHQLKDGEMKIFMNVLLMEILKC